ncbi:BZ3500_MvSof-1268-A1-R1_Chr10-2g03024 [Microbotryum saponariae]|uniref:BZ3500_MvSof-1268-A1-R1_Chr10-2g03024 protein n=1 Tax=Microbotryum saponariae TaxID=289078 RepID=A0A2X0L8J6_9BASI|nr:BZ3501_MvSof-1269-A2-R1_Chr10-2g02610 [Microbotryum saponariae]SDA01949.1 BZ3500_MvSof-1268-A1-R1_Chr10-2g03024 [Microbotryum saponariae]
MQALLASPSTRYDSPNSSFDSNSSSSNSSNASLGLPPLSSPFEFNDRPGIVGGRFGTGKRFGDSPLKRVAIVVEGDESFSDSEEEEEEEASPSRPAASALDSFGIRPPQESSPSSESNSLTSTLPPPAWMTDELDEEWVAQPDSEEDETSSDEEDDPQQQSMSLCSVASPTSAAFITTSSFSPETSKKASPTSTRKNAQEPEEEQHDLSPFTSSASASMAMNKYASLNQPKVPSSLRHGFTTHSNTSGSLNGDTSHPDLSEHPATYGGVGTFDSNPTSTDSDAGSCVVRSENDRPTRGGAFYRPSQLQAAVRALKGVKSAGLGAKLVEETDGDEADNETPLAGTPMRNGIGNSDGFGLMKLFEPPSPPSEFLWLRIFHRFQETNARPLAATTPTQTSKAPAPSIQSFTFTPPPLERTSYKSLVSPAYTTTTSGSATPMPKSRRKPVPTLRTGNDFDATPPSNAQGGGMMQAPALEIKDRVLRSQATTTMASTSTGTASTSGIASPPLTALPSSTYATEEEGISILHESEPPPALISDTSTSSSKTPPKVGQENFSPFPLTPAPQADEPETPPKSTQNQVAGTPRSAVKLFEFHYDTYTRDHLAALVEEIDRSTGNARYGSSSSSHPTSSSKEGSVWVDLLPRTKSTHEDGEEDVEENQRSNKRIRLSPKWSFAEDDGVQRSTRGRRITSVGSLSRHPRVKDKVVEQVSPSATRSQVTKERLDQANSLLDRIRAKAAAASGRKTNDDQLACEGDQVDQIIVPGSPRPVTVDSPLPKLAAAASALIRHALSGDSLSASSRSNLGHGRRPSLAQSVLTVTNLAASSAAPSVAHLASNEGSVAPSPNSRRHFATTPIRSSNGNISSKRKTSALGERFAPNSSIRVTSLDSNGDSKDPGAATDEEKQSSRGSTASSMTCATSGSGATNDTRSTRGGKGHSRQSTLTTIGPQDVGALLGLKNSPGTGRSSRMVFDQVHQRWIKTPRALIVKKGESMISGSSTVVAEENGSGDASGSTEDDPFRDFESTRASIDIRDEFNKSLVSAAKEQGPPGLSGLGITAETPKIEEPRRITDDDVGSPLDACYFEVAPIEQRIEDEEGTSPLPEWGTPQVEQEREEEQVQLRPMQQSPETFAQPAVSVVASSAPSPAIVPVPSFPIPTTPRGTHAKPQLPRSALKNAVARSHSDPGLHATPRLASGSSADRQLKVSRSVSFSDGKAEGKIEGLVAVSIEELERMRMKNVGGVLSAGGSRLKFQMSTISDGSVSNHAESVDGLVGEPGSLAMEGFDEEAPSANASVSSPSIRVLTRSKSCQDRVIDLDLAGKSFAGDPVSCRVGHPLTQDAPTTAVSEVPNGTPLPLIQSTVSETSLTTSSHSTSRTFRRTTAPDATFLTECSFGVSADRMVQYITDVEPFEPDWEAVTSIDLSGKKIESLVRLKEFLPGLDEINVNENQIAFLTGAPATLRTLLVASNKLSGLTCFQHLLNLESIDVSHNQIDSVHQFACLKHLRELKADDNLVMDLEGLFGLDGLQKLSLRGNRVEVVDTTRSKWTRLETLDLSRNAVSSFVGLERLGSLVSLNLDENKLNSIGATSPMPSLRVLRISANPLVKINVSFAPRLRTLLMDSAKLDPIGGLEKLGRLENLSLRDQDADQQVLWLSPTSLRDIKRLYLSSNPSSLPLSLLSPSSQLGAPSPTFFNLIYLELSYCQLTQLPPTLSSTIPNIRALDLSHNPLTSLDGLHGLARLTKLTAVGARLERVKELAEVLRTLPELQSLDLRMNPLTLSFYPTFTTTTPTTTRSPPFDLEWCKTDQHHRRTLSDEWYFRRLSYRSILLSLIPSLAWFDGSLVKEKERKRLLGVVKELTKSGLRE